MYKPTTRVAILDMYDNVPNEGMRCIKQILHDYAEKRNIKVLFDVFDVRGSEEVADLSYDIYISTGGPGSPIDSEGSEWEKRYFNLVDSIRAYNLVQAPDRKKYVFLICHSFQLFCRYYGLGTVCKRRSTSFGVFPVHLSNYGKMEPIFDNLADPIYVVDSRDWQVIQPNQEQMDGMGATILALEKERPHVDLERCVMSMRFDDAIIGTQFHPEADPEGMLHYLKREDKKQLVIEQHGLKKYLDTIDHLDDPDKIVLTHNTILPNFLDMVIQVQQGALV